MKSTFIFLSLSIILFSCQNEQEKKEVKDDLSNTIWVNAKYLALLENTKSPLQAKVFADTVMVNFNAHADTVNIVWNFHEGSEYMVKRGEKIQLFNAYDEKKTPEFEGNIINGSLKLGKTTFRKVDTTGFIEKKFWIGHYIADSTNTNIELKFDGKIVGVDSLATYYVWSDYTINQTDIDIIDFYTKSNKSTSYGYKFVGKDIVFYKYTWDNADHISGKAGKELFRWRRK